MGDATPTGRSPSRPTGAGPGTKRLTIDVPRELHRRLKMRAAEREIPMADLLRTLLTGWLENGGVASEPPEFTLQTGRGHPADPVGSSAAGPLECTDFCPEED